MVARIPRPPSFSARYFHRFIAMLCDEALRL
jgi:hypothetical protein